MALQTQHKPSIPGEHSFEGRSSRTQITGSSVPQRVPPPLAIPDLLWLLVAILVSLALRIPFFNIPMIADEGGYAYAARGWFEGTGRLYHDLWISRPQGIFLLYGAVFNVFGEGTWAFRFAAWIFVAFTVLAVWFFVRRWSTPRVANVAAILVGASSSLPNLEGYTANAEIFMGLPAAFSVFWLLRQHQEGWSLWQLRGVGILIGIATLLKPSGIVMVFVAVAFIVIIVERPLRERLRMCAAVATGIAAVGIPTMVHGWYLGWDAFIYATVTYRLTHQSSATVGIGHHLQALTGLFTSGLALTTIAMILLVLAGRYRVQLGHARHWNVFSTGVRRWSIHATQGLVSYQPVPPFHLTRPDDAAGMLIRLWALGAMVGIAIGGDWWSHYLIQIAPPFSLWFAYNIVGISDAIVRWQRWLFLVTVTILLLMPFVVLTEGRDGMVHRLYTHPGYPAQAAVARYLQEHTDPNRTIYVAFDQAAIYYLADRKPAYRHLYDQELTALSSSYADIIAIIHSPDRPEYIVSTLHPGPFPDDSRAFWREVGLYYDVETTIEGVPIYREKPELELPKEP